MRFISKIQTDSHQNTNDNEILEPIFPKKSESKITNKMT